MRQHRDVLRGPRRESSWRPPSRRRTRIRFGTAKGLGKVQYRLTADAPVFDKLTVRIHERLQVRDAGDEDVRKAEGDRVFVLGDDRTLNAQQDSLWSQVPKTL